MRKDYDNNDHADNSDGKYANFDLKSLLKPSAQMSEKYDFTVGLSFRAFYWKW